MAKAKKNLLSPWPEVPRDVSELLIEISLLQVTPKMEMNHLFLSLWCAALLKILNRIWVSSTVLVGLHYTRV